MDDDRKKDILAGKVQTCENNYRLISEFLLLAFRLILMRPFYRISHTIISCSTNFLLCLLAVLEKPVEVQVQDSRAHVGSNCILKCSIDQYHQDHYQVSSWSTDDGLILLHVYAYMDDHQGMKGDLILDRLAEKSFQSEQIMTNLWA